MGYVRVVAGRPGGMAPIECGGCKAYVSVAGLTGTFDMKANGGKIPVMQSG